MDELGPTGLQTKKCKVLKKYVSSRSFEAVTDGSMNQMDQSISNFAHIS